MTIRLSIRPASLALFGLLAVGSIVPRCAAAATPDGPVRHEFLIRGFVTEGGAVLPEARIVYGITGTLGCGRGQRRPAALPLHGRSTWAMTG